MSALGDQIRNFALARTGQMVGRGQCTDLALAALNEVGARSNFPHHGNNYVWGTPVALENAEPGDLLQFRHHRMVFRNAEGETETEVRGHPMHTAIVIENLGNGRLRISEQNIINPGNIPVRTVGTNTLFVRNQLFNNRTVTVSGAVHAFRAQASAPSMAMASGRR